MRLRPRVEKERRVVAYDRRRTSGPPRFELRIPVTAEQAQPVAQVTLEALRGAGLPPLAHVMDLEAEAEDRRSELWRAGYFGAVGAALVLGVLLAIAISFGAVRVGFVP